MRFLILCCCGLFSAIDSFVPLGPHSPPSLSSFRHLPRPPAQPLFSFTSPLFAGTIPATLPASEINEDLPALYKKKQAPKVLGGLKIGLKKLVSGGGALLRPRLFAG